MLNRVKWRLCVPQSHIHVPRKHTWERHCTECTRSPRRGLVSQAGTRAQALGLGEPSCMLALALLGRENADQLESGSQLSGLTFLICKVEIMLSTKGAVTTMCVTGTAQGLTSGNHSVNEF